jgi:hypothetical protein
MTLPTRVASLRILGLLLPLLAGPLRAQSPYQTWWTFNHAGRLSDRWGYGADANYRTRGGLVTEPLLTAIRFGPYYQVRPDLRVMGGYAWFGSFAPDIDRVWLHENRLWQQAQWSYKPWGLSLSQRVRTEQRWRELLVDANAPDGPLKRKVFNFRARWMLQLTGPLVRREAGRPALLSWQVANEILLQTTAGQRNRLFDQNRALAGVVWRISEPLELATLYQNIQFYRPDLGRVQNINSVRLTLFHNLDFRKRTAPRASPEAIEESTESMPP